MSVFLVKMRDCFVSSQPATQECHTKRRRKASDKATDGLTPVLGSLYPVTDLSAYVTILLAM